MSAPILKSYVDESGNISVRISKDVQVLTCEEAECIEAEYKRIQAENAKLREEFNKMDVWHSKELTAAMDENAKLRKLARLMWKPFCWAQSGYEVCLTDEQEAEIRDLARELEIEVD